MNKDRNLTASKLIEYLTSSDSFDEQLILFDYLDRHPLIKKEVETIIGGNFIILERTLKKNLFSELNIKEDFDYKKISPSGQYLLF